jgi:hypothetical protein
MRRIALFMAAFALLVPATPVLAAPGCGEGWDLMSESATLDRIDERIYTSVEWLDIIALVESVDANGDDLLCTRQWKPNQGQDKKWIGPEDTNVTNYVVTGISDNKSNGHESE